MKPSPAPRERVASVARRVRVLPPKRALDRELAMKIFPASSCAREHSRGAPRQDPRSSPSPAVREREYNRNSSVAGIPGWRIWMATVTSRRLEDDVVRKLKARAKANHRSLAAELRELLSNEVRRSEQMRRFRARAKRIARMTPDVPQTDSTLLLREDRSP